RALEPTEWRRSTASCATLRPPLRMPWRKSSPPRFSRTPWGRPELPRLPSSHNQADRNTMTVMMISEVSGQSTEGYESMLGLVGEALRQAPGFMMHTAHPVDGGWRIVEIWESREDATTFFSAHIA